MTPTKDTFIGTQLRVIDPNGPLRAGQIVTLTGKETYGDRSYAQVDHQPRGYNWDRFEIVEAPGVPTLSAERLQLKAIRKAAAALYLEGKWELNDGTPPETQVKLWEDLRDALGFKPGFNTTVSAAA